MDNETMPRDIEAEMSLLGSLILSRRSIDDVRDKVSPQDFFRDTHAVLYDTMTTIADAGFPIDDIRVLVAKLKQAEVYERVGGATYIAKLAGMVPNASHASYYADIVAEKSRLRQVINAAQSAIECCFAMDAEASSAVGTLEARLDMIGTERTADIVSMEDATGQLINKVKEGRERKESIGIPTGVGRLDATTGGSFPGELNVILARPSIGKTSLGFQIAKNAAVAERPALFVSLEMEEWELGGRYIAGETELDTISIRSARVDDEQMALMERVKEECRGLPFYLWRPRKSVTIEQIRAGVKMLKSSTRGCDIVVIDYLQKIKGSNLKDVRHEQLEHIIRASKDIASELSIPVTMLAQAKRAEKNRPPVLEDIKGSSAVEDEANNVWTIHREERHSTKAILGIAKARSGNTGDIVLGYDLKRTEFTEPNDHEY